MNNSTIILLGATGDLAKRKIIPAIYGLVQEGKLNNFALIGAALSDVTIDDLLEQVKPFIPDFDEAVWKKCCQHMHYLSMNFKNPDGFDALADLVKKVESEKSLPGNRLIYCSTASLFFIDITHHLARVGLIEKGRDGSDGKLWHRAVYEKPFGLDAQSAHEINQEIAKDLDEAQIFRIDHYLAKELVANIALVRFTNRVFEPLWSNKHIENVQIVLSETMGLEGRAHYYDNYGAMRDVVQNHMLQLLALVAMEAPKKLTGDYIRDKQAEVLKVTKPVDGLLGQYQGYLQESGVVSDSKTETFAALQLMVDNDRWSGVPFYLRTGKHLNKKEVVIYIRFKPVECLMETSCPTEPNFLIIRVSPDEGFSLELNAKKPRLFDEVIPVSMDYCHDCLYAPRSPQAYELLLEQVMVGEQVVSVRFDEIEYSWAIIDQFYKINLPVYQYAKDSIGPQELQAFGEKNKMRWRA